MFTVINHQCQTLIFIHYWHELKPVTNWEVVEKQIKVNVQNVGKFSKTGMNAGGRKKWQKSKESKQTLTQKKRN